MLGCWNIKDEEAERIRRSEDKKRQMLELRART
jgi:hypothetical protein